MFKCHVGFEARYFSLIASRPRHGARKGKGEGEERQGWLRGAWMLQSGRESLEGQGSRGFQEGDRRGVKEHIMPHGFRVRLAA